MAHPAKPALDIGNKIYLFYSLLVSLYVALIVFCYLWKMWVCLLSRVHNKRTEEEYSTLIIPCTNALRKVCAVNHRVLLFCNNTFRVTKRLNNLLQAMYRIVPNFYSAKHLLKSYDFLVNKNFSIKIFISCFQLLIDASIIGAGCRTGI